MGMIRKLTVAAALMMSVSVAHSQQPSAASIATAKELVSATGAMGLFNPLIAGVVEQARLLFLQQDPGLGKDLNEITAQIRADLAPRYVELSDEVAKLYATTFTDDEIKTILAFYQSPVGKKLLEKQPQVIDSSMKFAQGWANKLSDEVIARIRTELKKRGHNL
jgi:hypothetical protein